MSDMPAVLPPLRTWSHLAETKRKPSEYEVVSTRLHYHTKNPEAAWELDPDVFMNRWYREHRDGSALRHHDWDEFRDPDQHVYRSYIALQDDQETYVTSMLDEHDRIGHDTRLDAGWLDSLAQWYTPSRYPAHLLQMASAYVGQVAPASTITTPCYFQAADHMRIVQHTAYRTRELANRFEGRGFAEAERHVWENAPIWQGFRELLERLLITWDWGQSFIALNLVAKPAHDEAVMRQLAVAAEANGDRVLRYLADSHLADSDRSRRWTKALVTMALETDGNRNLMAQWVSEWLPLAERAVHAYLDPLPQADPQSVIAALKAWHVELGL